MSEPFEVMYVTAKIGNFFELTREKRFFFSLLLRVCPHCPLLIAHCSLLISHILLTMFEHYTVAEFLEVIILVLFADDQYVLGVAHQVSFEVL